MSQNNRHSAPDRAAPARAARPGTNVRRLRTERGLTIQQLAVLSSIDEQQLTKLEADELAPSIKLLWSLANALSVPFASLVQDGSEASSHARAVKSSLMRLQPVARAEKRGSVARRSLLPADEQRGRGTEVHELKLEPGSVETGAVYPRGARETVLVTAGAAVIRTDEDELVLHTGQSVELDAHGARAYHNADDQAAVLYIMVAPAAAR